MQQQQMRPSPFAIPPAKRRRVQAPETYVTSNAKYHVNYQYSFVEWQGLADPRWACECCGADFLLVVADETARFALGIQEVALHEGGRHRWAEAGECERCGVDWVPQQQQVGLVPQQHQIGCNPL